MPGEFNPYHRWLGIPPKDQPANYYRLLGIELFESDEEVIRDAAEQRMAHVRTYQLGQYSELSQRILNELAAAKGCLLDSQKKAAYDRQFAASDRKVVTVMPSIIVSPPVGRRMPPELPNQRLMPRWIVPTVIGAIAFVVVVAIAVFALMRHPGDGQITRETNEVIESQSTKTPKDADAVKPADVSPADAKPAAAAGQAPAAADDRTRLPRRDSEQAHGGKDAAASTDQPNLASQLPALPPSLPPKPKQEPQGQPSGASNPPRVAVAMPEKVWPQPVNNQDRLSRNAARQGLSIALPSGAAITESMLSIPTNWLNTYFPEKANPFVVTYPNNAIQGVFWLSGTKLHGPAATLHANGRLQTLAVSYTNGLLHGCLKLWDEDGKRVLYAEYQSGKKNGILCFFQEGNPWLIQECKSGEPQTEYLVKWIPGSPRVVPVSELAEDEITEATRARDLLADLEHEMSDNEKQLKKKLVQMRAASVAADKRAAASSRINAHNAAKSDAANTFWRKALQRSGVK